MPESATALAEFKVACDHWLPLLNERDQDKASTHVNSMFEKLKNSRRSPGEAEAEWAVTCGAPHEVCF